MLTILLSASLLLECENFAQLGGTVDMGCYEYRATPGFLMLFR